MAGRLAQSAAGWLRPCTRHQLPQCSSRGQLPHCSSRRALVCTPVCMGRRSSKIAGRKTKQDGLKAKVYGKIGKLISKEARAGGPDPVANTRLAAVLQQAKLAGVPKDIVTRNLEKAQDKSQGDFSEVMYEAYSASGSGFIIECLTDNSNRSATLVRTAISKANAKLAEPGSVAFQFKRCGQVMVTANDGVEEDQVVEAAADAGAEDVEPSHGDDGETHHFRVLSAVTDFASVRQALSAQGLPVDEGSSGLVYIPLAPPPDLSDEKLEQDHSLADKLLAIDDVDAVFTSSGVT